MIPQERVHIRQLIGEQTCFDERFAGKKSIGIFIDTDENVSIVDSNFELTPYENKINKNPIDLIMFVRNQK